MRISAASPGGQHLLHEASKDLWIERQDDPEYPLLVVASVRTGIDPPISAAPAYRATHAFPVTRELAQKLYNELGAVLR